MINVSIISQWRQELLDEGLIVRADVDSLIYNTNIENLHTRIYDISKKYGLSPHYPKLQCVCGKEPALKTKSVRESNYSIEQWHLECECGMRTKSFCEYHGKKDKAYSMLVDIWYNMMKNAIKYDGIKGVNVDGSKENA